MEKENTIKKEEELKGVLASTKAKYIVGTILFSGLGVALRRIFHIF